MQVAMFDGKHCEPSDQTSPEAFHPGRVVTINSTLDNCDACCCSPDRDGAPYDNASVCKATLPYQLASLLTAVA